MTRQSHLQIHIREFGRDETIPMAYPVDVTLADLKKVATTMLADGSVCEAKVVNTSSDAILFEGRWTFTVNDNGALA